MGLHHCIAIDPGRAKCGVAVVDMNGGKQWQQVVLRSDLLTVLRHLHTIYPKSITVLGDGTASGDIVAEMNETGYTASFGEPVIIDEYGSTEEARIMYLTVNRRGWRRWWPLGLQTPSEPVDDYVAVVLARRYIEGRHDADTH